MYIYIYDISRFIFMGKQTLVGHGFLIVKASPSHSDTTQCVGILWMSDQPVAETST